MIHIYILYSLYLRIGNIYLYIMPDYLIDNKKLYNFQYYTLKYFSILFKIALVLYITGFLSYKPPFIIELNFLLKIILAIFLIYRFNSHRKKLIHFTELDRKICFSSGLYILLISFADIINIYTEKLRTFLTKMNILLPFFK
jgi:hypothetical protein